MSGNPFGDKQLRSIVEQAINERDVRRTLHFASAMKKVGLDQALAITLLLGTEKDDRYLPAARRFLVRLIEELEPPLRQLVVIAAALEVVGDAGGAVAACLGG